MQVPAVLLTEDTMGACQHADRQLVHTWKTGAVTCSGSL